MTRQDATAPTAPTARWRRLRRFLLRVNSFCLRRLGRAVDSSRPRLTAPPMGWHLLSECTTMIRDRPELGSQNSNRITNMALAASLIHGLLVESGEVLSMRQIIGEPSAARGFHPGPVLVRGRLETASGGGLCQVSTTLYGAALDAGLEILEKHNHSTDLWGEARMVPLGRDAVYAYFTKDLAFKNRSPSPVLLELRLAEAPSLLKCQIWSSTPLAAPVRVVVAVHRRLEPSTPGARPGWLVETRRTSLTDGKEVVTYRRIDRYEPESPNHRHRARDP